MLVITERAFEPLPPAGESGGFASRASEDAKENLGPLHPPAHRMLSLRKRSIDHDSEKPWQVPSSS